MSLCHSGSVNKVLCHLWGTVFRYYIHYDPNRLQKPRIREVSGEDRHKMIGTHYHVMWHVPTGVWVCSLGLQLVTAGGDCGSFGSLGDRALRFII